MQRSAIRTIVAIIAATFVPFAVSQETTRANPFTGRSAEVENMIIQLERERLITQIETERATQARAREEVRRTVDGAKAQAIPTQTTQFPAAPIASATKRNTPVRPGTTTSTGATKSTNPQTEAPLPAVDMTPKLVGTAQMEGKWTAMLIIPGTTEILGVAEGQTLKGVRVDKVTQTWAEVNGKRIELPRVAGRAQISVPAAPATSAPASAVQMLATAAAPVSPTTRPIDLPSQR